MANNKRSNYITVQEMAREIRYHPETVRRWIHSGRIKGIRFGTRYRVTLTEWQRFKQEDPPEIVVH